MLYIFFSFLKNITLFTLAENFPVFLLFFWTTLESANKCTQLPLETFSGLAIFCLFVLVCLCVGACAELRFPWAWFDYILKVKIIESARCQPVHIPIAGSLVYSTTYTIHCYASGKLSHVCTLWGCLPLINLSLNLRE